jgi:hypothetical protein
MAFADYTSEVKVEDNTSEIYQFCMDTFQIGTWGAKFGFAGNSATYCFQYEKDAIMFMLRFTYRELNGEHN